MILLSKNYLDDELGWHSLEYYDLMLVVDIDGMSFKQVAACRNTTAWAYEPSEKGGPQ